MTTTQAPKRRRSRYCDRRLCQIFGLSPDLFYVKKKTPKRRFKSSPQKLGFLDLPPELRHMVYKEVAIGLGKVVIDAKERMLNTSPLLAVCKQIRNELWPVMIATAQIHSLVTDLSWCHIIKFIQRLTSDDLAALQFNKIVVRVDYGVWIQSDMDNLTPFKKVLVAVDTYHYSSWCQAEQTQHHHILTFGEATALSRYLQAANHFLSKAFLAAIERGTKNLQLYLDQPAENWPASLIYDATDVGY